MCLASLFIQFTEFSCYRRWCFVQGQLNIYTNQGPQKGGRSGKRRGAWGGHSRDGLGQNSVRT